MLQISKEVTDKLHEVIGPEGLEVMDQEDRDIWFANWLRRPQDVVVAYIVRDCNMGSNCVVVAEYTDHTFLVFQEGYGISSEELYEGNSIEEAMKVWTDAVNREMLSVYEGDPKI